jgi:hypothetical protein
MGLMRQANAWYDEHPRLVLLIDGLFVAAFGTLAILRDDAWGYAVAVAWTIRLVAYDWWWRMHRRFG